MKRFIIAALVMCCAMVTKAQLATYPVRSPYIYTSGSFTQPSNYSQPSAGGVQQIFPWYTKLDTVTNTGVDTFKQKVGDGARAVYTWVHVTSISGTNTSCLVKLWGSGDSTTGRDWAPIQTFTVTAANPAAYKEMSNNGIFTYTNFMWTFTGVGTHSSSWYAGMNIK